jgi:hypothetical protein
VDDRCPGCLDDFYGSLFLKTRKLLLAALVLGVIHSVAYADVSEGAHEFKEDVKEAGTKIGHGARDAAHATADASKKVGHAVANTARNGYHATKNAIHNATHKSGKTED